MNTQMKPRAMFAALGSLALLFIIAVSAHGQCGVQGRTFDQGNLSLGASLGNGNCPGGNCQLPVPVGQLGVPSSGAASASAVAGPQASANGATVEQIVAAVMQQMQAQGHAANAYKPLYLGSGGASASSAASVASAPMYAPAPVAAPPTVGLLSYQTLAVPTIPVALAGNSTSSASSVASGGGGCGGGRGFFRRASRSRTRTVSSVNGNRSTSSSVSVRR